MTAAAWLAQSLSSPSICREFMPILWSMVLPMGGKWKPMCLFAAGGGTVGPCVWAPSSTSMRADIYMLETSNAHCSIGGTVQGLVGAVVGAYLLAKVGRLLVAWWSGLMESG